MRHEHVILRFDFGLGIKMYYLQFANITYNEKRIISCIGDNPPIDPEETKKNIRNLFEQTLEFQKQQELSQEKLEFYNQLDFLDSAYNKKVNRRTGKFMGSKKEKEKIYSQFLEIKEKLVQLEQKIIDHAKITEEIYKDLFKQNAIYSTPRNAKLLTIEESRKWFEKFQSLKFEERLSEDGTIVTKKDIEKERISKLSNNEKIIEKESKINALMNQVIQMRNKLEIQGDEKALEKSQEWYNLEKAKIEKLYI